MAGSLLRRPERMKVDPLSCRLIAFNFLLGAGNTSPVKKLDMDEPKRTRTSRSKLQKGLTAKGFEFYYSKKPYAKKADYVRPSKVTLPAEGRSIRVKKKVRS
jgi:hypothetical protein